MKNIKTFPKIILFISMLSGTIWIGSYLTRLAVSYQVFEGTDFTLRAYLTPANLNPVFQTILPAIMIYISGIFWREADSTPRRMLPLWSFPCRPWPGQLPAAALP